MIHKLKKNITILITTILSISITIFLLIINIINITNKESELKNKIETLDNYLNNKNPDTYDEAFIFNEYYIVNINTFGETIIFGNQNSSYDRKELLSIISQILDTNNNEGKIRNFIYKVNTANNSINIILMDTTSADIYIKNMIIYSLIICLFSIFIIYIISKKIAVKVTSPIEIAFNKQRDFISDASHELKTPLTIITTNVELLKNDLKDNKWLNYIDQETKKMSNLIKKLLNLTKIDSTNIKQRENLSDVIESSVLPFESLIYEKNIKILTNIEENIYYICNKEEITNLVTILIDNAIRHTSPQNKITLDLEKEKNKIILTIKNQGLPIPPSEREKIFERFYRIDKVRNSSEERYGLGLAIAKEIVNSHQANIKVDCLEGWTIFQIIFKI